MAGFYELTNVNAHATLAFGKLVLAPRETRTVYLTDADEANLDGSDATLVHNASVASAQGSDGSIYVRDLDPNDDAHDHAIAEDVASGLVAAATWAELSALTGAYIGQVAEVPETDVGTHVDPYPSNHTVSNTGRYAWTVTPVTGWRWLSLATLSSKADKSAVSLRYSTRAAMAAADAGVLSANTRAVVDNLFSGDGKSATYVKTGGGYLLPNGWGVSINPNVSGAVLGLANVIDAAFVSGFEAKYLPSVTAQDRVQSDVTILVPATGLYVMKGIDFDRTHFIDQSNGQVAEIDVSHLPLARKYLISARNKVSTGYTILDCGPAASWSDFASGQYLKIPPGNNLVIERKSNGTYFITQLGTFPGATAPSIDNSYVRAVRPESVLIVGQSYGDQGFGRGAAHAEFCRRLAELGGSASVWVINAAAGGSWTTQLGTSVGSNYWTNYDAGTGLYTDGPLLTAAKAAITSRGGDATQPMPTCAYLDIGGSDSQVFYNGTMTKPILYGALNHIVTSLQAAGVAKVCITPIGQRAVFASVFQDGHQQVREVQMQITADLAGAGVILGPESYDLPKRDGLHPTDDSYVDWGGRQAEFHAKFVSGINTGWVPRQTIASATYNATENTITVLLNIDSADRGNYPVKPEGFTVLNSSGVVVPILRAHWGALKTLKIFLGGGTGAATGGTLYYIYNNVALIEPIRVPRGTVFRYGDPLRPAKITL